MLVRSEPQSVVPARPTSPADAPTSARRAMGLLAVSLFPTDRAHPALTFVAELDEATIARVRREALALRIRHRTPVTVELRYVADATAAALIANLADLATHDVQIVATPIGGKPTPLAAPARSPRAAPSTAPDPFGLDHEFRARVISLFRFVFEYYWRIEVSGIENVPASGPALVVANHSGAIPADAFMLAMALELRHPQQRCLRVLFDKFVDALPFIGDLYRRLGGVTASLANAESLLERGELVGLFPEGIAGVEKRFTERYRLRPFKTGTARLSVRTGSPIVPVAIVGAEEAYPVVARLYRAGRLVGLPWIPVTPLFPVCGLAGALPLPSKWAMHFGPPIVPPPADGRSEDERVAELTARLRQAIETSLNGLLAKRVGIFL